MRSVGQRKPLPCKSAYTLRNSYSRQLVGEDVDLLDRWLGEHGRSRLVHHDGSGSLEEAGELLLLAGKGI
jgi:hypothetical protein